MFITVAHHLSITWLFSTSLTHLLCDITNQLMSGPWGTVNFVSLKSQCFPEMKLRETLRFKRNKINCFPWDQTLKVKYCIPQPSMTWLSTSVLFTRSPPTFCYYYNLSPPKMLLVISIEKFFNWDTQPTPMINWVESALQHYATQNFWPYTVEDTEVTLLSLEKTCSNLLQFLHVKSLWMIHSQISLKDQW